MAKFKKYDESGEVKPKESGEVKPKVLTEDEKKALAKKRRKGNIVSAIVNPIGFLGTKAGEAIKEGREAQSKLEGAGAGDTKAGDGEGKEKVKNAMEKLADYFSKRKSGEEVSNPEMISKVYYKEEESKKEDKVEEERKNVEKVEPKKAGPISLKSSSPNIKKARLVTSEKEEERKRISKELDEVKLDDIGEKEGSEDKQKKQPVSNTPSRLDRKVKEVKSMKLDLDSKPRATLKKSSKSKLAVDGKSKKKEEPKKKKRVYNPRTNKFEFR